MSTTVISKGFIAILKMPITDDDDRERLNEMQWDAKTGVSLNYEGTLIYLDTMRHADYADRENFYGIQSPQETKSDAFVDLLDALGFEVEVGSLMPYTCIWYNGADNPVDELTVDEFRQQMAK